MPKAGAVPRRTEAPAKARAAVPTRTTAGFTYSGSQLPYSEQLPQNRAGTSSSLLEEPPPCSVSGIRKAHTSETRTKDRYPDEPRQPGRLQTPSLASVFLLSPEGRFPPPAPPSPGTPLGLNDSSRGVLLVRCPCRQGLGPVPPPSQSPCLDPSDLYT